MSDVCPHEDDWRLEYRRSNGERGREGGEGVREWGGREGRGGSEGGREGGREGEGGRGREGGRE